MSWKMMDLAVRQLNVSALKSWKNTFLSLDIWMQAVLVGVLVLLFGAAMISCWWGLKMNRYARFVAGAAGTFYITLIILSTEYAIEMNMALIYAAAAGAAAGFLYAFLERAFQFAAGFVFGTVLSAWVLPKYMNLKLTGEKGRIWGLVIAIAAGVLFALLAKKLKMVLTALEGGVVLGLLCDVFLPVTKIPWVRDKLSGAQVSNLLPFVIAGTGLLIQFFQWLAIRAEQKALQIPAGEERDSFGARHDEQPDAVHAKDGEGEDAQQSKEAVSMAKAEEVLVEKAKELALAAERNAQQTRLKERYADVAEGLYSAQAAAKRLGMTEEAFVQGMKQAGFTVPGDVDTKTKNGKEAPSSEEEKTETAPAGKETGEAKSAPQDKGAGESESASPDKGTEEAKESETAPEERGAG